MSQRRHILFLCTGNSARSILAEAIVNRDGADRFRAFSAGSAPKREVHPAALELLSRRGYAVEGLRSKSWNQFAGPDAPPLDIVITVCGNAAGETCPVWRGTPARAHWGIDDPAAVEGESQPAAFEQAHDRLKRRIDRLLALSVDDMEGPSLSEQLQQIGRIADQGPDRG